MISKLLAQGIINPVIPQVIGNPNASSGGKATGLIITNVLNGMFVVAFILTFIYLITGGFFWITSTGDKANLEHARNKIIHAIVGMIIVAATYAIMILLGNFLGLNLIKLPIPSINQIDTGNTYCITNPNAPRCQGL